jgi:transposase
MDRRAGEHDLGVLGRSGLVDIFRKADTMSKMGSKKTGRRARRQFTDEFRTGAVRLVLEEGKTVGAVARELDLTPSSLTKWVSQVRADRSHGKTGLTTTEREELARLRKENRILQEEREILKKATAFFAKQSR